MLEPTDKTKADQVLAIAALYQRHQTHLKSEGTFNTQSDKIGQDYKMMLETSFERCHRPSKKSHPLVGYRNSLGGTDIRSEHALYLELIFILH